MADTHEDNSFYQRRSDWRDRVMVDRRLSPGACRVAYYLSNHFNLKEIWRNKGQLEAYPSLETIGADLGINEKTVRRNMDELIHCGYLTKVRGGQGRPNRYRVPDPDRTAMSTQEARPDKNVQSGEQADASGLPATDQLIGHSCPDDRTFLSAMTGQKCPTTLNEDSNDESNEKNLPLLFPPAPANSVPFVANRLARKKTNPPATELGFEEFWTVFPRKKSKGAAERAYKKALQFADFATLIAGARRYAAEEEHKNRQYTKHPATWLSAKGWLDEAEPQWRENGTKPFHARQHGKAQTSALVSDWAGTAAEPPMRDITPNQRLLS